MNETNTYKKFKDAPRDNFPEMIIVHHSGGTDANPLADTSNHTAEMMEAYHLSKGWEGLAYQYVIHKDGAVWLGRPETYHGAHTVGYNNKSIGICMAGNFDATMPTNAQIASLKALMLDIRARYPIIGDKVYPHRKFAKKTCYGSKLPDDWALQLINYSPLGGLYVKPNKSDITELVGNYKFNLQKYMLDGYKTWLGIGLTVLGFFHLGYLVNADQLGNLINAVLQIVGLITAIYGNYKAHQKIATLSGN